MAGNRRRDIRDEIAASLRSVADLAADLGEVAPPPAKIVPPVVQPAEPPVSTEETLLSSPATAEPESPAQPAEETVPAGAPHDHSPADEPEGTAAAAETPVGLDALPETVAPPAAEPPTAENDVAPSEAEAPDLQIPPTAEETALEHNSALENLVFSTTGPAPPEQTAGQADEIPSPEEAFWGNEIEDADSLAEIPATPPVDEPFRKGSFDDAPPPAWSERKPLADLLAPVQNHVLAQPPSEPTMPQPTAPPSGPPLLRPWTPEAAMEPLPPLAPPPSRPQQFHAENSGKAASKAAAKRRRRLFPLAVAFLTIVALALAVLAFLLLHH